MLYDNLETAYIEYVSINTSLVNNIISTLEDLRPKEDKMRDFKFALIALEKVVRDIGFINFEKQLENMINDILDLDTVNIKNNILKVEEYIEYLESHKNIYKNISESIESITTTWDTFLKRYPNMVNSVFNESFNNDLSALLNYINSASMEDINEVSFKVSDLHKYIDSIIEKIEKINSMKKMYIFLGDDAQDVLEKIDNLLTFSLEFKEFNEEFNKLNLKFQELINNSETRTVGFPVVKVFSEKAISYTILINNNILKYNSFFMHKNLSVERLNKYVFFDNYPYNGIFYGKSVVKNFFYSSKYLSFMSLYEKYINNLRYTSYFLFILVALFSIYINSTMFTALSFLCFSIYYFIFENKAINFLQHYLSLKFKLNSPFIIRDGFSSREVLSRIFFEFDNIFNDNVKKNLEVIE